MKKMRPKQAMIVNVVLRKNVLLSCFCLNRLANGCIFRYRTNSVGFVEALSISTVSSLSEHKAPFFPFLAVIVFIEITPLEILFQENHVKKPLNL